VQESFDLGILAAMTVSEADIDWMIDIQQAAKVFGGKAALCGNFDPLTVMLHGSPTQVTQAVLDFQEKGGERCFNAASCEIPDRKMEENILAQAAALKGEVVQFHMHYPLNFPGRLVLPGGRIGIILMGAWVF
jgi:uroporphyrinogen-III decarboxylase